MDPNDPDAVRAAWRRAPKPFLKRQSRNMAISKPLDLKNVKSRVDSSRVRPNLAWREVPRSMVCSLSPSSRHLVPSQCEGYMPLCILL